MEKILKKNDIWSVFVYLILYSIIGFFIETVFGIITKGVIESRKSFLYGPFCAIYGIGAISMILFLKNEKNLSKIFIKGALIGAAVEYLMSLICEKAFGVKWWDYSGYFLNINGRTCLFFAVSWGVLAMFLIKTVNPVIDNFIGLIRKKDKVFKTAILSLIILFVFDALFTGYALKIFYYRIAAEQNLDVQNKNIATEKYSEIKQNESFASKVNNYYSNEKILKNYPNMIISGSNKKDIFIGDLVKGTKSYYYSLGEAAPIEK